MRALTDTIDVLKADAGFTIITRDHDALTGECLAGVRSNEWDDHDGLPILRFSADRLTTRALAGAVACAAPSAIYANSLFSRLTQRLLIARQFGAFRGVQLVLAPEGELDEGALSVKPTRKAAWLAMARVSGLLRGIVWKAASEIEAAAILKAVPDAEIIVVPHPAPARPPALPRADKEPGRLRLLFLSRIAAKKNLSFLLRALRGVTKPVHLSIVGPVEDRAEWRRCDDIRRLLPNWVTVRHEGPCEPDDVWSWYAGADVFALPTLGENHGYVIEDALRAGCPPIISDRTPWNWIATEGAGFVIPLSQPATWSALIDELALMNPADHRSLSDRSREAYALNAPTTRRDEAYASFIERLGR